MRLKITGAGAPNVLTKGDARPSSTGVTSCTRWIGQVLHWCPTPWRAAQEGAEEVAGA